MTKGERKRQLRKRRKKVHQYIDNDKFDVIVNMFEASRLPDSKYPQGIHKEIGKTLNIKSYLIHSVIGLYLASKKAINEDK